MAGYKVLLVEDHKDLAETIGEYLTECGFIVDFAMDGVTGLHLAVTEEYDGLILDVMLPGMNGFQVCQKVRSDAKSDIPILMLTARDQIDDKLQGFGEGADDYLTKPFNPDELVARMNSLIRRYKGELNKKVMQIADLTFDPETKQVFRAGQNIKISPTGMQILKILMQKSPQVISKEALARELWGELAPESDVLRSHLYLLRKMIDKPFDKQLLHTLPAVGVKIEDVES